MTLIRFKNQTEYAFLIWMGSYPESFHSYDMDRFYSFVKTLARYRSKKWRDDVYFRKRILEITPHFSEKNIDTFYDLMQKCLQYHNAAWIDSVNHSDDGKYGYAQVGVKNGQIYEVPILKKEFLGHGKKV